MFIIASLLIAYIHFFCSDEPMAPSPEIDLELDISPMIPSERPHLHVCHTVFVYRYCYFVCYFIYSPLFSHYIFSIAFFLFFFFFYLIFFWYLLSCFFFFFFFWFFWFFFFLPCSLYFIFISFFICSKLAD